MIIGRIRVLVAGDIYVNRSLVRPFLEDDGYEVVGEPLARDDVLPAVQGRHPDALVIDDRLLSSRGNGRLLHKIRRAAPEAKVVIVTSAAGRPKGVPGVDAYMEHGMSLAALSATLGHLFAAEPEAALAGVGAAAEVRTAPRARRDGGLESGGGVLRFVATVGTPVLVAWALIAMLATGGGTPLPRADRTEFAGGLVIVPQGIDRLDEARDSLERMIDAIEAGNYPLATLYATALMEQRRAAMAGGFLTAMFDDQITANLNDVVGLMPAGAAAQLQGVLGDLFPVLESEDTPGGGSDVILGPIVETGSSTGGDTTGTGNDGGGGGGGDGGGGDGDGETVVLGPGDGRAWGQSHKLTKGDGGPPPWANGNIDGSHGHRGDPPGLRTDHGSGQGSGNT
jgi:CheY-like chemotaxis protein